jgi:polysaccharide pyruvyl transferase WcaK-like protein
MNYQAHTEIINIQGDYSRICNELKSADLVIGSRLHSLVAAACFDTPVLALALSDKVRYFMNDIGLNRFTVQIKDINNANELYQTIVSTIRSIKGGTYPLIAKQIAKQREQAELNITSLETNI